MGIKNSFDSSGNKRLLMDDLSPGLSSEILSQWHIDFCRFFARVSSSFIGVLLQGRDVYIVRKSQVVHFLEVS